MIDDQLCTIENRRICEQLKTAGISVRSVYELLDRKRIPIEAIPILIKSLRSTRERRVREGIIRSLAIPKMRELIEPALIPEFRRIAAGEERGVPGEAWVIGNTLSIIVCDNTSFDSISELLLEKQHGRAREMLCYAIAKMKDPRAVDILIKSLKDPDVEGHAIGALGRIRSKKARRYLVKFLDHHNAWIRREAKKAISRIDAAGD